MGDDFLVFAIYSFFVIIVVCIVFFNDRTKNARY